ncbi:MAG: peptide-methionine (S)-S-oxide reductase MsrA [Pseudomonadota bacterium]
MIKALGAVAVLAALAAFFFASGRGAGSAEAATETAANPSGETRTAIFAGGCFWCVEADFEKLNGVVTAVSGYTGGTLENPTYEQVTYGRTGHYEAVEVTYDPVVVSYRELVVFFFRHVDPLDPDGQFCDQGTSYRTAIFAETADERLTALEEKERVSAILGAEVVTPVIDRTAFYVAEDYHQDYYLKNKIKYSLYRTGCGRDRRLEQLWGDKAS